MELFREQAWIAKGRRFAVFDGGYALVSVVQPLISPEDGSSRIEFLTRLRHDDRLHALPPKERPKGKRGPMPKWGKRLSLPRQGGRWVGLWQVGDAFIYGRLRKVRWKEVVCLWHVVGPEVPAKAVVAYVEGYKKRFTLVSSALARVSYLAADVFLTCFVTMRCAQRNVTLTHGVSPVQGPGSRSIAAALTTAESEPFVAAGAWFFLSWGTG